MSEDRWEEDLLSLAMDMRDFCDNLARDDDVPQYRRNQARTLAGKFDRLASETAP